MNEPSVDVVISSNRATPYLYEAVASVRAQTWAKWQLIIVDDGSPDPDFFDDLGRSVPGSLVVHQPPAGLPAARNTGTRAGEGALIAFLDDDDVWHPERLERQVQALEESPESVAAYSGGWYMDAGGVPFGDAWPASPTPSELFLSGAVNIPRIVTLMVRREVCESIGGSTSPSR